MLQNFRSDPVIEMLSKRIQGATIAYAAMFAIAPMLPVDRGFIFRFISVGILLRSCEFGLPYASLQQ